MFLKKTPLSFKTSFRTLFRCTVVLYNT